MTRPRVLLAAASLLGMAVGVALGARWGQRLHPDTRACDGRTRQLRVSVEEAGPSA